MEAVVCPNPFFWETGKREERNGLQVQREGQRSFKVALLHRRRQAVRGHLTPGDPGIL